MDLAEQLRRGREVELTDDLDDRVLACEGDVAAELGIARNTVLYAYEQLASEGYLLPDRRGTVVAVQSRRA